MTRISGVKAGLGRQRKSPQFRCCEPEEPAAVDYDALLRNLFRSAPLGLYQADLSGSILCGAPGRCPDDAASQDDERVGYLHPQDRKHLAATCRKSLGAGENWSQQFRYRWADGRVSWLHAMVAPVYDSLGNLTGYQGCNIDVTEQVESQAELAVSEDRYRVAAEASRLGVWDLDVRTNNCYFTPFCFEMLGYKWGRMHGDLLDWSNIVHPEYLEEARRILNAAANGEKHKFELELRLKTNEGKWRWFRCKGKSVDRDESGKALRLIGTLEDVNQAKMMEHLLRMEHDLLNLITATSPVGIMFIEPEGNVAFANPRAEKILGLTKQEIALPGDRSPVRSIVAYSGGTDRSAATSLSDIINAGGSRLNDCYEFKRGDGENILLSISTAPFQDKASRIRGTVVTFEDVTEQKQREQVLADNDRLLRETQRIAQLGSYVLDINRDTWSCSSKLYEILGIDESFPRTLRGHVEVVHEDYRDLFLESYLSAVRNVRPFEMEYKIRRRSDGEERWVTECCELTKDATGKQLRMIGTIKDITERKAAEEAIRNLNDELDRRVIERTSQLAAAKKEIESFSYSVSHDLRAPLRHINSYSSILVEEYGQCIPAEARTYLDRICTASCRMGKQIDDLLTMTRVGRATMKRKNFNISELAADVVDMLREGELDRRAEFVVQPGIKAYGDSALVRHVLQNLLGNAVKYSATRPSPKIEFGQQSTAGKQTFYVRDNGVGFDMAYLHKLFQPFQRLHGSEFEGTGIGLATVRRIIERHGGSIWAEGGENLGATFYFTLS